MGAAPSRARVTGSCGSGTWRPTKRYACLTDIRTASLPWCCCLTEPPALEGVKVYRERYQELIGPSLWECPVCHEGRMLVIEILPRSPHRKIAITDTS